MIVVDASVVTEAVAGSALGNLEVLGLLSEEALVAPQLLDLEVLSALKGLLVRDELSERTAGLAVRDLGMLPILRLPHDTLLERCWELRHNLSVYDACYVALAEILSATLLTSDRRLARAPGIRCNVKLIAQPNSRKTC